MAKTRPPYAPEFRRQMVELVRAGRSPEELAQEFEPTAQSIRNWVRVRRRPRRQRVDDGGARGTHPAPARESPAQAREGYPLKSRGLVCSGDEHDPIEGYRFVSENQAAFPIATHVPAAGCLPQRLL
jgi:transposase